MPNVTRVAASAATKKLAGKLDQMIQQGNDSSVLLIGISLALLKDGVADIALDFLLIGEIPVIGQLPGMAVSIGLMYFMWGSGMMVNKIKTKVVLLLVVDMFPLLNNIPMTVVAVLMCWQGVKERALKAQSDLSDLNNKTNAEIQALLDEDE